MSPLFTHGSLFGPLWCKWMSSDIPPSNINVPPFYWGWAQYVSNPLLSTHTSLVCEKLFKIKFQMGISKVISRSKKTKQKKSTPPRVCSPPLWGLSASATGPKVFLCWPEDQKSGLWWVCCQLESCPHFTKPEPGMAAAQRFFAFHDVKS